MINSSNCEHVPQDNINGLCYTKFLRKGDVVKNSSGKLISLQVDGNECARIYNIYPSKSQYIVNVDANPSNIMRYAAALGFRYKKEDFENLNTYDVIYFDITTWRVAVSRISQAYKIVCHHKGKPYRLILDNAEELGVYVKVGTIPSYGTHYEQEKKLRAVLDNITSIQTNSALESNVKKSVEEDKTKFYYHRMYDEYGIILPNGGITVAFKKVSGEIGDTYHVGLSVCSVHDRFVKQKGKELAQANLNDYKQRVTVQLRKGISIHDVGDVLLKFLLSNKALPKNLYHPAMRVTKV